jgi:hypothetical protein
MEDGTDISCECGATLPNILEALISHRKDNVHKDAVNQRKEEFIKPKAPIYVLEKKEMSKFPLAEFSGQVHVVNTHEAAVQATTQLMELIRQESDKVLVGTITYNYVLRLKVYDSIVATYSPI